MKRGLSVIVPAYNEGKIIEATLDSLGAELAKLDRPFEVVVADDCSKDDTLEVMRSYAKSHEWVRVATHVPNRGKGAAIRTGFLATTMPIVAYIDADIRPDAPTLARYVDAIDAGHHVVMANKWDPASHIDYSFARKFASYAYAVFAKALFWIPIVDTQCGFKFFERRLLEKVMPRGTIDRFGFDIELLAWCVEERARFLMLPIEIEEIRTSRVTYVEVLKMFKDLLIARIRIWQTRWRARRAAPRATAAQPRASEDAL